MRLAVIDMGTNTFNVLVVESSLESKPSMLYHNKVGVMLGKGGINEGFITKEAFNRAIDAVGHLLAEIGPYNVDKVKAFATSAVRSASNGTQLVSEISSKYNIDVEIISGDREAELIYKGVCASLSEPVSQTSMILDIGGGSNEFIICNADGILWEHSFPLGMSRIIDKFQPLEPITPDEVARIESYLSEGLPLLWTAAEKYRPKELLGASGAFDTIRDLLYPVRTAKSPTAPVPYDAFESLHDRLLKSTLSERLVMEGMDCLRAEMMVVSSILVNLVLNKTGIKTIIQSDYSLKEGAVAELLMQK